MEIEPLEPSLWAGGSGNALVTTPSPALVPTRVEVTSPHRGIRSRSREDEDGISLHRRSQGHDPRSSGNSLTLVRPRVLNPLLALRGGFTTHIILGHFVQFWLKLAILAKKNFVLKKMWQKKNFTKENFGQQKF